MNKVKHEVVRENPGSALVASSAGQTASVPLVVSADTFFDTGYKPLGSSAPGSYCVVTSYTAPPAVAVAGAQGNWYAQDCYASSAKGTRAGTVTVTYAVEAEAETATTLLLKVTSTARVSNGTTLPATSNYRVTAGAITRVSDTTNVSVSGGSVNLAITYQ
jgi:hypothetical protein